jgi:hypothetical protein
MSPARKPETLASIAGLTPVRSVVVANATATRDLPHRLGPGVADAAVVHAATLAALSDRFSIVVQDTGALSSS